MNLLKYKTVLNILLIFSVFSILFALYVEYVIGHKPCNLCLLQRLPYIMAIILIILVTIFKNLQRLVFLLLGVIFFIGTLLSIYHVGIEQGLISESFVCGNNIDTNITDKTEILKQLENKAVSCKDVTFTIIGVSLATINTFISLIIAIITISIFIKYEKK
tara:strand:+ start:642 stop:1124 length:483 start_codon:yes stop_codon:yes gene_type:complete